jgi:hypothetical protein
MLNLSRQFVLSLLGAALCLPAARAQVTVTPIAGQSPAAARPMPGQVLVVDAAGQGDFTDLPEAVAAAPSRALLLVKPGMYQGTTISGQGLRVEGEVPGSVLVTSALLVTGISADQEVSLGGLVLEAGFEVSSCSGQVSMTGCTAPHNGGLVPPPPGLPFTSYPQCGIGQGRNRIVASAAVSLVECTFEGRNGMPIPCDGSPGEHALVVEHSRVAIYGGSFVGGDGADAYGCHGAYAGAGGNGIHARGAATRIRVCDASLVGGTGGRDFEMNVQNGCPGQPYSAIGNVIVEFCSPDHVTLDIEPLVQVGSLRSYTITGPPGASVFLMVAPTRGWREFSASEGVLHMGAGFATFSLGTLPASGMLSRPFPTPMPAWVRGYASVELQAYARIAGQDRYSEPRSLQAVFPGL